jgi:hypothetical protein
MRDQHGRVSMFGRGFCTGHHGQFPARNAGRRHSQIRLFVAQS